MGSDGWAQGWDRGVARHARQHAVMKSYEEAKNVRRKLDAFPGRRRARSRIEGSEMSTQ